MRLEDDDDGAAPLQRGRQHVEPLLSGDAAGRIFPRACRQYIAMRSFILSTFSCTFCITDLHACLPSVHLFADLLYIALTS
jgi:hypothetical protein